ncbi:unnamed protein product [marine sediment metagenome]|uniref:Uncharacterized protein n=1 Tax=marine sediment metagenome TaxID=412755 RepID=X0XBX0_9ZZZZ
MAMVWLWLCTECGKLLPGQTPVQVQEEMVDRWNELVDEGKTMDEITAILSAEWKKMEVT